MEEYLTTKESYDVDEAKKDWLIELMIDGFPDKREEILNLRNKGISHNGLQRCHAKIKEEERKREKGRIVYNLDEAQSLLAEGWANVTPMGDGSFFVKRD